MNHSKFRWDYPTQGLRHPRTMSEAFGPYATIHVDRRGINWSHVLYAIAGVVLALTVAMMWVTR